MSRRDIASSRDRGSLRLEFFVERELRSDWGEKMSELNGWIMNVVDAPRLDEEFLRWFVRRYRGIWDGQSVLKSRVHRDEFTYPSYIFMVIVVCTLPPMP